MIDRKDNGNLKTLQSPDSESLLDSQNSSEIDILVVDVDSEDPRFL